MVHQGSCYRMLPGSVWVQNINIQSVSTKLRPDFQNLYNYYCIVLYKDLYPTHK